MSCAGKPQPGPCLWGAPATLAELQANFALVPLEGFKRRKGWWGDDAGEGGRQASLFDQKLHILGEHILGLLFWQAGPVL